jgi:hypothetical protein
MLKWGLTIYPEFTGVMGLLTEACMVTGRYEGMSQLAGRRAVAVLNTISDRFNTGVTQRP